MARIRTIKPDFWTNEKIMQCKPLTRLLFIGMWNFADDYGRMQFAPMSIKARVFPADGFSVDDIRDMLNELGSLGLLMIYSAEGKEYIEITGWDHQKIDKRQVSKIPGPFADGSRQVPPTPADLPRTPPVPPPVMEGNGMEGNGEDSEAKASGAVAPRDLRSELFGPGLAAIAKLTGRGPDACRSFVGKCLKASQDDAGVVLGLIYEAERNRVVDASAWIAARLKERGPPLLGAKPLTPHQGKQQEAKDIVHGLKNFGAGSSSSSGQNPRLLGHDPGKRPGSVRDGAGENVIDLPPSSYRAGG